jgi:hypothetical protein
MPHPHSRIIFAASSTLRSGPTIDNRRRIVSEQRSGGRLDGAGVAERFMDIVDDLGANDVPTRNGPPKAVLPASQRQ